MPTDSHTPLTPLTMAILVSLAESDRHGYALMKSIKEQTDGGLRPGTGSLYAALQRLMDDGLIVETKEAQAPANDRPRRVYQIAAAGRKLAETEALRMLRVVRAAHKQKLISDMLPIGLGTRNSTT